jgi:ParB family chromosome partitioning protein
MKRQITEIEVSKLIPNPNNPRKDIGDISELTESIKSNGIMQNLTVMKTPTEEYMVLIGHRRLSAAKAAGFTTVPCMIIDELPVSEQVGIMLLENLQRNDLTILEQAQSFQMMLDLGDTVDGISEKTGFAKSTIHHRLNIAKLDQDVLNEKIHQLTLKDLIALEQVSDIEKRNEILENAYSSQDIARRANDAAREEKREHIANILYKHLERQSIKPLPEELQKYRWSSSLKTIKEIDLDGDDKFAEIEGLEDGKQDGQQVYYVRWPYATCITVLYEKPEDPEEEKEETPEQRERLRISKNREKVKDIQKRLHTERDDFLRGILTGKIEDSSNPSTMYYFWIQLMKYNVCVSSDYIKDFCFPDDDERSEEEKDTFVARLSPCVQMLILLHEDINTWHDLMDYEGRYRKDNGDQLISMYLCLEEYGFKLKQEDEEIIYGTSDIYEKDEEED